MAIQADYIGSVYNECGIARERVTTLHVDLGRQWRGGQGQALLLIRELQRHGYEAELVAIEESPLAERARAAGVRVHTVPRSTARFMAALRLARARADIIHCHDAHGLTAAWLASRLRPMRFVASRRVAYPLSGNWFARLRYHHARRIIAVSEFVKASVAASGFSGERVDVVYDGVELPDMSGKRAAEGLLGCVGYLLPEKNQELLIRAFPAIVEQRPNCRLLLAGDGPCRGALEQLAARLGVSAAVEFAGFVDEVAAVHAALGIFLFPSLAEPLGSSLLSAMAWGLPVVALASGAVPEIIEHEKNGLLVNEPEPRAFADAILRLLGDSALGVRLGAAARRTVEEHFTAAGMMQATLEVYRKASASGP